MSKPKLKDLSVYRTNDEVFEVCSWLTRGRCATVYKFAFSKHMTVREFLIPKYMQEITTGLILEAVDAFLENEKASAAQHADTATEPQAG